MSKDYTLRMHTRLGYGDAYGSTSSLPFYEHYYAGGFSSVRGFEDSSLGPRSTPSDGSRPGTIADPDQDPLPFGGNVLIQGGLEVRCTMPFVRDQRSLRTSVSWAVGNVDTTNSQTETKNDNDYD